MDKSVEQALADAEHLKSLAIGAAKVMLDYLNANYDSRVFSRFDDWAGDGGAAHAAVLKLLIQKLLPTGFPLPVCGVAEILGSLAHESVKRYSSMAVSPPEENRWKSLSAIDLFGHTISSHLPSPDGTEVRVDIRKILSEAFGVPVELLDGSGDNRTRPS